MGAGGQHRAVQNGWGPSGLRHDRSPSMEGAKDKNAAAAAAGARVKPSKLKKKGAPVPKPGYLSPAAASMTQQQSKDEAPGRSYRDTHLACCPCIEPQALFKDLVFDYDGWQRHKSWRRHGPNWWICLQVTLYYWPPLLVVALVSAGVGLWHTFALPRGWPNISDRDFMSPFELMSFVLSLLLVFRTNSAWEARIMWGTVTQLTRDTVRQAMSFAGVEDGYLIDMIGRWTIALPYVLKAHVTELTDLSVQLRGVLLPHELRYLHDCQHRPNVVGQALSDAVNALDCHPFKSMEINKRISEFMDLCGGMERLYRQPIPSSYTRHTSRFLVIWTCFLPFALWTHFGWLTPFVSVTVTFLLLGVENIGIQIEQPFSVLPLELFCATIRSNVIEQLQTRPRGGDLLYQASVAAPGGGSNSARPSTDATPPSPQALSRDGSGFSGFSGGNLSAGGGGGGVPGSGEGRACVPPSAHAAFASGGGMGGGMGGMGLFASTSWTASAAPPHRPLL